MDKSTLFYGLIAIAAGWWFLSRIRSNGATTRVTYTDTNTGQQTTVARKIRQPQNRVEIEKPKDFEITEEIRAVLDTLENTNANLFLTGKAGTGKSTLLRYFRAMTRKGLVVVAPTGIAAINVQGQTIHSFFGWGPNITPDRARRASYQRAQIYRNMKMLIIDEVSMVRADLFECIDRFLRLNAGSPERPFGGVQVVAIGDLYQLPPVVTGPEKAFFERNYESPFFFSTDAYRKGSFKKFELNKVYRQKDPAFVEALNAIREGHPDQSHIRLLNTSVVARDGSEILENHVHIVTTNKIAKEINDVRMARLSANPITYTGSLSGAFSESNVPTDIELTLKTGARVMLLNNEKLNRWVNGDIVDVIETRPNSILVQFSDDTVGEIAPHTWETVRFIYDEEEGKIVPTKVGSFTQIPVKPAWAMTIHKAQGQTFDKVFIDLGAGAFAEGQTYVALSRCKTLEGLRLAAPLLKEDVFINPQVRKFMSFAYGKTAEPTGPAKTPAKEAARGTPPLGADKRPSEPKAQKLSHAEFVIQEIKRRRTGNYKGIHAVFSGFNEAFRDYFNEDPVKATEDLAKRGVIIVKPSRGGVILYDANEASSDRKPSAPSTPLGKILDS